MTAYMLIKVSHEDVEDKRSTIIQRTAISDDTTDVGVMLSAMLEYCSNPKHVIDLMLSEKVETDSLRKNLLGVDWLAEDMGLLENEKRLDEAIAVLDNSDEKIVELKKKFEILKSQLQREEKKVEDD